MRTKLVSTWWNVVAAVVVTLVAYGQNGFNAQSSIQQDVACPVAAYLIVNDTLSLGELYSYLDDAGNCDFQSMITVDWGGTVELSRSITIPNGVELRIRGVGHGYEGDGVSVSSSTNSEVIGINEDSKATMTSVIRGNGSVRLFYVSESGILVISGIFAKWPERRWWRGWNIRPWRINGRQR